MEKNRRSLDYRIDYGVLMPVFILVLIGLLSIYVALSHSTQKSVTFILVRQMVWVGVSLMSVFFTIRLSPQILWKVTVPGYFLGLFSMVLPLVFYDFNLVVATGSKNWVSFGGQSIFQPSELMKVVYILFLAFLIVRHNAQWVNRTKKSDFQLIAKLLLATLPVVVLLKLQSDLGTMLVFIAILFGMALISGISWKIVLPTVFGMIILGSIFIYLLTNDVGREILRKLGVVKGYQLSRIDSWLDPFHDPTGHSFQQAQGILAIGSGGLLGKGFNRTQLYVPVRESDMIFTVIGENFGFVGCTLVILLYFILIYRMFKITYEANNQFYTYIATGLVMMILFHVFENIGANIGLLPLTGIPLPFISQGGSSMLGNFLGIGLILSIYFHQHRKIGKR
jgi:rod shape determining protein RodA